jgi:hypothetical protein
MMSLNDVAEQILGVEHGVLDSCRVGMLSSAMAESTTDLERSMRISALKMYQWQWRAQVNSWVFK